MKPKGDLDQNQAKRTRIDLSAESDSDPEAVPEVVTPDLGDPEFRETALIALRDTDWIVSVACAEQVTTWLQTHADVVQELIDMVAERRQALGDPVGPLTEGQRAAVWALVTTRIQVPARQQGDGCEYLAHAVCEVINEAFPAVARRLLKKQWLIASSNRLHPPENWHHHVAAVLECTDGWWALDPLLRPTGPLIRDAWIAAATGNTTSDGLNHRSQPWELLGSPAVGIDGFDPQARITSEDGSQARTDIDRCKKVAD